MRRPRLLPLLILLALAAPASADAGLVVFGPISSAADTARTRPVAEALTRAAVGVTATAQVDVACTATTSCLAAAGAAAGAKQALAVVLADGKIHVLLVDVVDRELVARRELTISDRNLRTELGRALVQFLGEAPIARAKALFATGNRHYELGEFAQALENYKKAYRVKALPAFLFNIAQCHRKLGQHAEAIQMYQSYLVGLPQADNKPLVESLIAESHTRLAEEHALARTRETEALEAGKQRAEEERKAKEAEAQAEAERRKAMQIKLDAERQRELDKSYDRHPARTFTIVTGVVGAGVAAAGGYFGLKSRNLQSDFDDAGCGDPGINHDQATLAMCAASRDDGKSSARLGTILMASGGALVVASVIVFIIDPGNVARPRQERAQVAISPTSIQVMLRW